MKIYGRIQIQYDRRSDRRNKKGNFVIVVDDEDRENEGDLVIAAEYITPIKSILWKPMLGAHLRSDHCRTMRRA